MVPSGFGKFFSRLHEIPPNYASRRTSIRETARPIVSINQRFNDSTHLTSIIFSFLLSAFCFFTTHASQLDEDWANPPRSACLRAYWWWLNGNVTKASITRDLEEMKSKGFGGALICDADGSAQDGNTRAPHGPTFFSREWRELFKHTLREADRLGLEMSLNIQSGWNLGGPMVKPDDAPKKLVWTEVRVRGATNISVNLKQPEARDKYYRDLFVIAFPVSPKSDSPRRGIQNLPQKALIRSLEPFSAPDSTPLFEEFPATPGEEDTKIEAIIDLTAKLDRAGTLRWLVPPGEWEVIRFGCTLNDHCHVSTCSQGWDGYALDPFDSGAFKRYWNAVVEPLIGDAGPLAGKALKYLHTDSWEIEVANWTPTLREEFKRRRGYDLLPWLPVIARKIVNSRNESDRFLYDFRRTFGDLAIANHYQLFRDGAHRHGMLIHPESGGPHAVPIDAQQCLGFDDAPMSEFWAWSWTHRIGDENRFFVKQPASAAHAYGHNLVLAEGFTTIGPHWQETLWDNLKPAFDHACTEGLNLLVWHAFVCSPASEGVPGQQYFAGTHLNPNVTWWAKSAPFFAYINRCQSLLQQGLSVADVAYYYGSHVPNFARLRKSDPARLGAGYDYDVVTEEVILNRMSVRDGRLVLPDGMSYQLLKLPDRTEISLPALRKLSQFAAQGATIVGPKPLTASGWKDFAASDAEVKALAEKLWIPGGSVSDQSARDALLAKGVRSDFEWDTDAAAKPEIDFIHRRTADAEIYFVASRSTNNASLNCTFRVSGKAPELWDAVSGDHHFANNYSQKEGVTTVPLLLPPCGSCFVVFRESVRDHPATAKSNSSEFRPLAELQGAWEVSFDPRWGGPKSARFDSLVSWTTCNDPGIKFYSGTAIYHKTFDIPPEAQRKSIWLDLGDVRELAEVRVNGQSCGITWSPPFRVDVSRAIRPGTNQLEIEVVNFWPNRIVGDASLPQERRLTRTNIRKLTAKTSLIPSGLFGPVRLLERSK